jgi:hypothetical protein
MKTRIVNAVVGLCLLFSFVSFAGAQTVLATLEGRVTDGAGRAIPGATVTITSNETGQQREARGGANGEFEIPNIPAGSYSLNATAKGFRAFNGKNIVMMVDQTLHLDVKLLVGGDTAAVTAPIAPLMAESGAVSFVIEDRNVTGLPLDGRNFYELALLLPGTAPAAEGSAGSVRGAFAMNVNGGREDSNNFLLDGVYNNDPKLNGVSTQTPVDAIREFEVATNSYDASFGRNAAGQVNVITRSGGNQWHGTLYDFFRNSALDGLNYFAPTGQGTPKDNRNQFGGTLGGPIVKDHSFFFMDYEGRRFREGITQVSNVPTPLERVGNFSQSAIQPINPLTGTPFPGNIIPSYYDDPSGVGPKIINLYPMQNRNVPGQNYVSSPTQFDDSDHFDLRFDQILGQATTLTTRYSLDDRRLDVPFAGTGDALIPGYGNQVPSRSQNAAINLTHSFSSRWLIESRLGFNRVSNSVTTQNPGVDLNKQVGLPEVSSNSRDFGLSQITVPGYSVLGDDLTSPQHGATDDYQIVEQASYVRGRSILKFGGDIRYLQQNAFRDVEARGFLQFLGDFTNSPLADLLLGYPTVTGAATSNNPEHLRTHSYDLFVQDTYRLHPNLTLTAGVRYEYNSPGVDAQNHANLFSTTTDTLVPVGTGTMPRGGYVPDRTNFAPRVGVAWSHGSWVVRTGYGIYYDQASLAPGEGLYFSPPYFNSSEYYTVPGPTPYSPPYYTLTLSNPFPSNFIVPTAPTALAYQRNLATGYVQQWNLAVQRQINRSLMAEVGYVGSKGTHLLDGRDINQAHASTNYPNYRPLPQFADIDLEESAANSSYNALQTRLQQRLAHGVSALVTYTFGKSLDDASGFFATTGDSNFPQNSYDLRAERGRSDFDIRQRLTVSYYCDLPQGHNIMLKGWQTAGIWTLQSGQPFTPALEPDDDNANTGIDTLGFGANDLPNRIASGTISNPGPNAWFNTKAFVPAPYGSFGNSGRDILDGPGLETFNVSILKNTSLGEHGNLQFRTEFFNILNHTNFSLPDNYVGSPTFGQILSAGDPRRVQFALKWLF